MYTKEQSKERKRSWKTSKVKRNKKMGFWC